MPSLNLQFYKYLDPSCKPVKRVCVVCGCLISVVGHDSKEEPTRTTADGAVRQSHSNRKAPPCSESRDNLQASLLGSKLVRHCLVSFYVI